KSEQMPAIQPEAGLQEGMQRTYDSLSFVSPKSWLGSAPGARVEVDGGRKRAGCDGPRDRIRLRLRVQKPTPRCCLCFPTANESLFPAAEQRHRLLEGTFHVPERHPSPHAPMPNVL